MADDFGDIGFALNPGDGGEPLFDIERGEDNSPLVGTEDFSDGPSYFTLNELVHGNTLVSDPTPLQIIRNPRVPDLHAQITNVVCTYRITGEHGELLALDRQAIADAARVKMGLACDFQKPGALMTNISLLGADHHPKPMMYKKTATHQLAAHSPEDAVLVAHTFTHELSKIMGVRVYPSPIVVHNIVTVMDAGRHLDRDLIRQVTKGQHRKASTAASATGKNTRKKFPAEIVYSRRVPPVVFLFFTSGQVTSCGAPTREHVRIGLEEVSEILNAQYQLVIAPGNADLQLDKVSREAVEKRDSMAKANALVRHNLATRPNAPVEQIKVGVPKRILRAMPVPEYRPPSTHASSGGSSSAGGYPSARPLSGMTVQERMAAHKERQQQHQRAAAGNSAPAHFPRPPGIHGVMPQHQGRQFAGNPRPVSAVRSVPVPAPGTSTNANTARPVNMASSSGGISSMPSDLLEPVDQPPAVTPKPSTQRDNLFGEDMAGESVGDPALQSDESMSPDQVAGLTESIMNSKEDAVLDYLNEDPKEKVSFDAKNAKAKRKLTRMLANARMVQAETALSSDSDSDGDSDSDALPEPNLVKTSKKGNPQQAQRRTQAADVDEDMGAGQSSDTDADGDQVMTQPAVDDQYSRDVVDSSPCESPDRPSQQISRSPSPSPISAAPAPKTASAKKLAELQRDKMQALKATVAAGKPKASASRDRVPANAVPSKRARVKQGERRVHTPKPVAGYQLPEHVWTPARYEGLVFTKKIFAIPQEGVAKTKWPKHRFTVESRENQVITGELIDDKAALLTQEGLNYCLEQGWKVKSGVEVSPPDPDTSPDSDDSSDTQEFEDPVLHSEAAMPAEMTEEGDTQSQGTSKHSSRHSSKEKKHHKSRKAKGKNDDSPPPPPPESERSRKRTHSQAKPTRSTKDTPGKTLEFDNIKPSHNKPSHNKRARVNEESRDSVHVVGSGANRRLMTLGEIQDTNQKFFFPNHKQEPVDKFEENLSNLLNRMTTTERASFFHKALPALDAGGARTDRRFDITAFARAFYERTGKGLHEITSTPNRGEHECEKLDQMVSLYAMSLWDFAPPIQGGLDAAFELLNSD